MRNHRQERKRPVVSIHAAATVARAVQQLLALCALAIALGPLGCAPPGLLKQYATPRAVDLIPEQAYPLEVTYEMLGVAKAEACGDPRGSVAGAVSIGSGEVVVGNPALFQEAKYLAIESVPNADNLLYIRAKVERQPQKECVSVTGRAYRVLKLLARAPGSSAADDLATPPPAPAQGDPASAPLVPPLVPPLDPPLVPAAAPTEVPQGK